MKTYAMTGGGNGIGAELKNQLKQSGHRVIDVDIQNCDIVADLATKEGRQKAIEGYRSEMKNGLDGFIPCAGLGAHVSDIPKIVKVNYFGVTDLIEGILDLVEKKKGSIVIISSNSAPMPKRDQKLVKAMLDGDETVAIEIAAQVDGSTAYISSKHAITRWMRRNAPMYIKRGIRLNAVAPGATKSALLDEALVAPSTAEAMNAFVANIPIGYIGKPSYIASAIQFLMSDEADFICGSVLFVDGGHDAMLRPDNF